MLFISEAWAQAAGGAAQEGPSIISLFLPLILLVAMYFLMIHPQVKRAKEHKKMTEALQKGDEVVTTGGTLGRITKLNDNYATLEVAPNVEIVVQRSAVQTLLPKGTIKSIE